MNLDALSEALSSLLGEEIDYMQIIETILNLLETLISRLSA